MISLASTFIGMALLAQLGTSADIVPVAPAGSEYYESMTTLYGTPMGSLQEGITEAKRRRNEDKIAAVTVMIGAADYTVDNIDIDTSGITLKGYPSTRPFEVVINGSDAGQDVITVDGVGTTFEGITISGGKNGIGVGAGSSAAIDRCYVAGCGADGINSAGSIVVSNSPVAANAKAGIRSTGAASAATVTHCSVLYNGEDGIRSEAGTLSVDRSFIYENAMGDPIGTANVTFEDSAGWTPDGEWQETTVGGKGAVTGYNADPTADTTHPKFWGVDVNDDGLYNVPSKTSVTALFAFPINDGVSNSGAYTFVTPATFSNAVIKLRITHPNPEQLSATLSDGTTQITLFSASQLANLPSGTEIMFSDFAERSIANSKFPTVEANGYLPVNPFAKLLNDSATTWTLTITDGNADGTANAVVAADLILRPMIYLTSPATPAVDVSAYTNIHLSFDMWCNQDFPVVDVIEYRNNAAEPWKRVWGIDGQIKDSKWVPVFPPLTCGFTATALQVRFGYNVPEGSVAASGWNIDNIKLHGVQGTAPYGIYAAGTVTLADNFVYPAANNYGDAAIAKKDGDFAIGTVTSYADRTINPNYLYLINNDFLGDVDYDPIYGNSLDILPEEEAAYSFTYLRRDNPTTIGADEAGAVLTDLYYWSDCIVTPDPCGSRSQLTVDVFYEGSLKGAYVLPEGGDYVNEADRIPLTPPVSHKGGWWRFKNVPPIPTVVNPDGPTYADGVAHVYIVTTGDMHIGEGHTHGVMLQDAIDGSEFLIDTIAPVLVGLPGVSPYALSVANAGPFGALGVDWGSYEPLSGHMQVSSSLLNQPHANILQLEDGSPMYLYNVGSISNGYPAPEPLMLQVSVKMLDRNLSDVIDGAPSRQVSGFDDFPDVTATADEIFRRGQLANGAYLPARLELSGLAMGFDVTFSAATAGTDDENATAIWTIDDGIPYPPANNSQAYRGAAIPRDRAGNVPEMDVLPPMLNILWNIEADTKVTAEFFPGNPYPLVRWTKPIPQLGIDWEPMPLSCWSVWASTMPGLSGKGGPYVEIQRWTDWSPDTWRIESADLAKAAANYAEWGDRYLLVVIGVVDECGNVTPWPPELAVDGNGDLFAGDNISGNWLTFYVGGRAAGLETGLSALLGYQFADGNTQILGPTSLVSMPTAPGASVFAQFTVDLSNIEGTLYTDDAVLVELEADGNIISNYEQLANGQRQIVLDPIPNLDEPLRINDRKTVVNYVIRATHIAKDQTGFPVRDETPASFAFKIIRGTVSEYLKSTRGEQPVKSFENQ